jgi:hypothetical protein
MIYFDYLIPVDFHIHFCLIQINMLIQGPKAYNKGCLSRLSPQEKLGDQNISLVEEQNFLDVKFTLELVMRFLVEGEV